MHTQEFNTWGTRVPGVPASRMRTRNTDLGSEIEILQICNTLQYFIEIFHKPPFADPTWYDVEVVLQWYGLDPYWKCNSEKGHFLEIPVLQITSCPSLTRIMAGSNFPIVFGIRVPATGTSSSTRTRYSYHR
eukprot:1149926-Rhodomonas_salina.2